MVLMTEKIGQGPTRRCDARCYNGKHAVCSCICGGKNHGAGLQQAMDNVREIFLPIIESVGEEGMKLGKQIRAEELKKDRLVGLEWFEE